MPETSQPKRMKGINIPILSFLATLVFTTLYEAVKEQFFPHFSKWESHIVTIVFVSVLGFSIAAVFAYRREILLNSLDEEFEKVTAAEQQVKRLLEEKNILLREVHHRIKNNMATVAGLLEMQAESAPEGSVPALEDATNRVSAMMQVYDRLYRQEDYSGMDLGEYLGNLADSIYDSHSLSEGILLEKNIQPVDTCLAFVYPLGLILNELMVNAYKYAFPDKKGTISISLGKPDNDTIRLEVADTGQGIKQDSRDKGFGMHLVEMLVQQLKGTMAIENVPGTKICIKVPLPTA